MYRLELHCVGNPKDTRTYLLPEEKRSLRLTGAIPRPEVYFILFTTHTLFIISHHTTPLHYLHDTHLSQVLRLTAVTVRRQATALLCWKTTFVANKVSVLQNY